MTECQNWLQDRFGCLRLHIRCKRLSKSAGFKSQARGASASASTVHNISNMWSTDTTLQPQHVKSPTTDLGYSSDNQQVLDQFTQMRSMLSSSLRQKQETTTQRAFCNHLASNVEGLEEKNFLTFRDEAVKLLSNIQSKAKENQKPHQQTHS